MLETGRVLAHYEIVRLLGKGGMGEVYEARDTKLGRSVALKVLPQALASDTERRSRFEREAKAVAALQHPNIVTLHAIEEADGLSFLVMELIEGEPLSEAIPAGGYSLAKFLEIAIPLADAVAAAHSRGITHRDLKPANVVLDAEGRPQVLDFGLAKVTEAVALGADSIEATEALTGEGRVLGTVAYMSPEQVEGREVDPRSDIFSLGVLFYEMITGKRPFEGDTSMSVLTSILRDEPVPVTERNQRLPRHVGRIVKRCLQKDPPRRFQSAFDLRNDLMDLRDELSSGELAAVRPAGDTGRAPHRWLPWALTLGLAVVAAAALWWGARGTGGETAAPGDTVRVRRLTVRGSPIVSAISPDGRYVVYVSEAAGIMTLRLQQIASGSDIELAKAQPAHFFSDLAFTADGEYVRYRESSSNEAGTFREIPALGGSPQRLADGILAGPAQSPDGSRLAFVPGEGVVERWKRVDVMSLENGKRDTLLELPGGQSEILNMSWSPDGERLAIGVQGAEGARLMLISPDGGEPAAVPGLPFRQVRSLCWSPAGESLIVIGVELGRSQGQPWLVDPESGRRHRVLSDFNDYLGCSTTADGRWTATVRWEVLSQIWVVPVEEPQAARPVSTTTGRSVGTVAWLDPENLVYSAPVGGAWNLWRVPAEGGQSSRLTFGEVMVPDASDDGRLVFSGTLEDQVLPGLYALYAQGGEARRLTPEGQVADSPAISPDGEWVVYSLMVDDRMRVVRSRIEGGEPELIPEQRAHEASVSPDGSRIAIHVYREDVGRWQTAIYPLEGDAPERVLDVHSETYSPWAGSDALYIRRTVDGVPNLYRVRIDDLSQEQATFFTNGDIFFFDVSPDLSRLAVVHGETVNDLLLVEGLVGSER